MEKLAEELYDRNRKLLTEKVKLTCVPTWDMLEVKVKNVWRSNAFNALAGKASFGSSDDFVETKEEL